RIVPRSNSSILFRSLTRSKIQFATFDFILSNVFGFLFARYSSRHVSVSLSNTFITSLVGWGSTVAIWTCMFFVLYLYFSVNISVCFLLSVYYFIYFLY